MHEKSGAFDHDPQRKRDRANEPIPTGPLGDPPAFFNERESAIWHELASQAPPGVLTVSDRIMVEMVCRLIARDRAASERANRCYECGEAELPAVEPLKAAERNLIISCLARMGMSAADRSKLHVKNPRGPEQPSDPFSELASRARGRSASDVEQ